MRTLMTGATGFIGRALLPQLVAHGRPEETILLLRETHSGRPLPAPLDTLRPFYTVVYADLRNFRLTQRAVSAAAPECVIHLAAAGVTDPFLSVDAALRHNVNGTLNLLRACFEKSGPTQRVIVARTPGERTALNVYAASKAAAWSFCQMYARTHRWPIHGATIFQAYGPAQNMHALIPAAMRAALADEDFPMTSGHQRRDWIYIDDVVAGLLQMREAALAPGTSVDLATGCLYNVHDVVTQIYAIANSNGRPLPGTLPDRPGEVPEQVADVEATAKQIDWHAQIALAEGLARTYAAQPKQR